jgi:signal transduction histidine kinase
MFSTEMYQQEVNQKLNAPIAEQIAGQELLVQDRRVNEPALKGLFHNLMVINPSIEIYLLDPSGTILAYSAPPGKVKREKVNLAPVRTWITGSPTLPYYGDDPRDPSGKKVFTAARIPEKGPLEGYLYVILGGEQYDTIVAKLQSSYILKLSFWIMAAGVLFALTAGLLLFAQLTGRLKKLAGAMDSFRRDHEFRRLDLPIHPSKKPADEIDRIGMIFREMAERIDAQIESLRRAEKLRRELVANVSHDLRTPLAALQGYVETLLLKEPSLNEQEHRDYLETAYKHCQRLTKLVDELLDLARLEAEEITLHREPINLTELVYDVVQEFQLKAQEKDIKMLVRAEADLPYVNADIALIQRVLENLIENAIHYTLPQGSISIALIPQKNDISVRVSDTGVGIPQAEIPNVFNRFHKLPGNADDTGQHFGLGLAITKKIIELHERSIVVMSTLDAGTTFTFHLPIHNPS